MVASARVWERWELSSRAAARVRAPQKRWVALRSFLAVALMLLFANGLSTQTTGRSVTNDPTAEAPLAGGHPRC